MNDYLCTGCSGLLPSMIKKISSALISVYHKDGLAPLVHQLNNTGVTIYATGGTRDFIEELGVPVIAVEDVTAYPSILGGRVKTLHPKVFGGILGRRNLAEDLAQLEQFEIPSIDLVIVDLYPFEQTVESGGSREDIIEKIDIGGISLIRAAAKNFDDVVIVPSLHDYSSLSDELSSNGGATTLEYRKRQAARAFAVSSAYDSSICNWFNGNNGPLRLNHDLVTSLRYGENPHQRGTYYGNLTEIVTQLSGKELSWNNLLDIDAAINLVNDFEQPVTAILKHNNACGVAEGNDPLDCWERALKSDPVSAFGGIIVTTSAVHDQVATAMGNLFFEVLIAPEYSDSALEILRAKKNRIILRLNTIRLHDHQYRTILNGVLAQDRDVHTESENDLKNVTRAVPSTGQTEDLLFANRIVKHARSNAIVIAKGKTMIAAGVGQTSRVDALNQAIEKARKFDLDLQGAVMASDAFFPFPDCVQLAHEAGITAIIQPGGSVKDQESIDYCDSNNLAMVFTGIRHFRH
jgi:phosphoribosylaminoimidazolecarboxamide formyltransferase / IMP cyclohydrolase